MMCMSADVVVHVINRNCNNTLFIVGRHEEKNRLSRAPPPQQVGVQVVQDFNLKLPQVPNPSGSHDSPEETEGSDLMVQFT